uniref:Phosphoesterase n=1 Tax=Kalanchoe fedtschenkoi TaxID=63787 RepID=A0A7N0T361_KALFE
MPSSPIKTIMVIIMENRSFDHMSGWIKSLNPEINGVDGAEYQHINASDPSSQKFFMNNQSIYIDSNPGHSFQAIREQIFGSEDTSADLAPMNGFAQQSLSMRLHRVSIVVSFRFSN